MAKLGFASVGKIYLASTHNFCIKRNTDLNKTNFHLERKQRALVI